MKKLVSVALSLLLMSPAFADGLLPVKQVSQPVTQSDAPIAETVQKNSRKIILEAGTRIPITIYNTVNSDNLKTGDMISVSVNENIKVNGILVFKKGSTGILNVSRSVKSGGHGKAGLLEISGGRVNDIYGNTYPINASLSSKGSSKRGWAIASSILGILVILVPFGLWVDGTPATIQGGQYIDAITTASAEVDITEGQEVSAK
ncbi:MAG: hypothetical protein K0Q50_1574 [Vampirovibrio sp.]|jgi:hypothetical protein|nr:hypothetical protein [Vampirovibrio sp.]